MYFVDGPTPAPLGIYDRPSDTVGVNSVEIPAGWLSHVLRDATRLVKRIEDALPGHGWGFVFDAVLDP